MAIKVLQGTDYAVSHSDAIKMRGENKTLTDWINSLYDGEKIINIQSITGNESWWIESTGGTWQQQTTQTGSILTCNSEWAGKKITIVGSTIYKSKIAFLKSNAKTYGQLPDYCVGENNRHDIDVGATVTLDIPSDCTYFWFAIGTTVSSSVYVPSKVYITLDGQGIFPQINKRIESLEQKETTDIDIDLSSFKDENWYYFIHSDGTYRKVSGTATSGNMGVFYPLRYKAAKIYIEGSDTYASKIAFLKTPRGNAPDYCIGESGRRELSVGGSGTFDIPSDCKYIWIAVSARTQNDGYLPNAYRPKKITLKGVEKDSIPTMPYYDNRTYGFKNGEKSPLNNAFGLYEYIRCASQNSIPVGSNAMSYADFIAQWDSFTAQYSEFSAKVELTKNSQGQYSIYKYVYTPAYYEKTIFLTAGMHGNEYEGFWGLLRCMQYILENGDNNDIIGYIKRRCRIIIIPVLNPYGVQYRQRYSTSSSIDQNYNFDVAWGKCDTMTGESPFYYKEPLAVKLVCDQYEGEISFHIDFHTDPFNANHADNSKCNYIEADENSIIFPAAYRLTLDERAHIKKDLNYSTPASDFVIWTNNAATSFRYMEWVRNIPSIIVEITTSNSPNDGQGFAGASGSAEVMKATVDWYLNCIAMMVTNVL